VRRASRDRLVADGVVRLGSTLVNWYLVVAGDGLTVVDAGLPGYAPQIDAALAALNREVGDVRAVVLTHGHVDHIGVAEGLRERSGARLLVHEADQALVRTGEQPARERGVLRYLWRPSALRLFMHLSHAGGARIRRPAELETFGDGDVLDVPGRPRVVWTPGHSEGNCCLHFADRNVLFAGDTLCTLNVLTGRIGPQIPARAFNGSSEQALASLGRIEGLDADVVLVGHGEPWRGGVAAAVARAADAGTS
jgi:glyoxylase-like metal-dependent hydrolase (beta-lactamase superfamily II)